MSQKVYSLRLRNGKFYVGMTRDIERRFQEHLDGDGAEWTAIHAPSGRDPVILCDNASALDEDRYTKELMFKYGINNVRGGSYCQTTLTSTQRAALEAEERSFNNACHRCGLTGHFATYCPGVGGSGSRSSSSSNAGRKRNAPSTPDRVGCRRCGRRGHSEDRCFARTDVRGVVLQDYDDDQDDDDQDGSSGQEDDGDDDDSGDDSGDDAPTCYRCGYNNHFVAQCFARKSIDGGWLKKR